MNRTLYLRLRKRLSVKPNEVITLSDICQLYCDGDLELGMGKLPVYQAKPSDGELIIIDIMQVIRKLRTMYPELQLEVQGAPQIIVEVISPKKKPNKLLVCMVWLLLFIGSGLAIMNFHADVDMIHAHRRLYFLVTGKEVASPLMLQIPYSIGIGIGMVLFFNHLFQKKLKEEPSPLEVELFLYQQSLDQYYLEHENKENQKTKL